jgi:hypothetical protein
MKKVLLLILAVFSITLIRAEIIEKTYEFNDYRITHHGEYQIISFENTLVTGITGEPVLAYQSVSLLLPPGHVAESIEFIGAEETLIPGQFMLYPQQHSQPLSIGKSGEFVKNETVYLSENSYPINQEGTISTEFMNGYAFALSTFTPLKYNPSTGEVSFYKKVTIRINTRPGVEAEAALNLINSSDNVLSRINHFAQNGEMISQYPSKSNRDGEYQIMIITPELFENDYQELIDLYFERGMLTEMVTTEFIASNVTGQDLQEKIRNYIIQEYTDHAVEYVLLGGDVEHVPYRGFYCTVQSSSVYEDDNIPSDLYYSGLDGTWNDNGNNLWGEIGEDDLLPDIAVARFTVSNITDLNNMINKSVSYQNNPINGELNRPLLAGEHLWSDPETWGADYLDLLIGYHEDNGYTTNGIPEGDDWEKLYAKNGSWNGSDLIAKINQGKSFVHHVGHANYTYVMHLYPSDITNSNFSGVNGIDHNYTNVYTHGCMCGGFDQNDCIAEDMVTLENFAAAFVGNSRYGWFNEGQTEGPSQHLHREFVDAVYTDKLYRIGRAHMESRIATAPWVNAAGQHEEGALRWCFYDCNVLGDPAMAIWTDNLLDINAEYTDAILIGVPSMDVTVTSDGDAVEGLRCTVIKDGVMHGVAITDELGNAVINFDPVFEDVGNADLIISGYNCLPTYYLLTVIPNGGSYVVFESYELNDNNGNGNGLPDFGELIDLTLNLTNVGTATANDLVVTLSTDDDYISITDNTEGFDIIEGGETISLENAFAFEINTDIPDQHMVYFNIEVEGNEIWTSGFSITVNAPQLVIRQMICDDSNGGNGDGRLDPGETVNIIIETGNAGHCVCYDATATLSTTNNYIVINSSNMELGTLEPGIMTNAEFNITVEEDAPLGTTADLICDLVSGDYNTQHTFYSTVGIIDETFESAGFQSFDWLFAGNQPWVISEVDPYEGQYCAQSGDIGDNQTSSMIVTMEVLTDDSISFFRKVSSEVDYDYLRFYIDNTKLGEWSGEVTWKQVIYPVTAGEHTFKWEYYKDSNVSNGMDCAWVDYIVFPPVYIAVSIDEPAEDLNVNIYPNPASGSFQLEFFLDGTSDIKISLLNLSGQVLDVLEDRTQNAGPYVTSFDAKNLTPGIYFCKVETGNSAIVRKIIIIR